MTVCLYGFTQAVLFRRLFISRASENGATFFVTWQNSTPQPRPSFFGFFSKFLSPISCSLLTNDFLYNLGIIIDHSKAFFCFHLHLSHSFRFLPSIRVSHSLTVSDVIETERTTKAGYGRTEWKQSIASYSGILSIIILIRYSRDQPFLPYCVEQLLVENIEHNYFQKSAWKPRTMVAYLPETFQCANFLHLNISINISYCSSYISNSPDKENVMNTKEFLYLVIISLNIMTFMANSAGKSQEGMKCQG